MPDAGWPRPTPMTRCSEACYRVARSPLHGRGLFATRTIRRGEYIGTFEGRRTDRQSSHVLWLWDDDAGDWQGLLVTNALRFTNHSDEPNACLDGLELIAHRKIHAGEEITICYDDC